MEQDGTFQIFARSVIFSLLISQFIIVKKMTPLFKAAKI